VKRVSLIDTLVVKVSNLILQGADMSDKQFFEREIQKWKNSPQRIMQIKGHLYYDNEHDILHRKRMMIGEGGELQEVDNLPNNRLIDNQYAKLVNQKANYLLGQPFAIEGENQQYVELLKKVFNKRFMKTLKAAGKAMLNNGICWLYPYYTETGEFSFRMFPGYEVLPFWKDTEHTILEAAVRLYLVVGYQGTTPVLIEKVEIYDLNGVHRFILDGSTLIPDLQGVDDNTSPYTTTTSEDGNTLPLNWAKVPLIPLKYNECEIPLLKKVKTLQDGINVMLSDFENNMQEDARNTILVLKNYDGENLGEFRHNLSTYGAVKVREDGGVETLQVEINAENYKGILELLKKSLIENARGYDAKDDRLSGNPNQMNIQSMYSDIDLDANGMETEFQAAFEELLWFINQDFSNRGLGDYEGAELQIVFNRDILINETESIENCAKSVGILSTETIVEQHPWVTDVEVELARLRKEKDEAMEQAQEYAGAFQTGNQNKGDNGEGE
jgi:SPP1 family phage portal protein